MQDTGSKPLKIVYWPRLELARKQIEARLSELAGIRLVVAETLARFVEEAPGAVGVILPDAPLDQAKQAMAALAAPGATVRWMHVVTAGRNGLEAAGLPPGVAITTSRGASAPTVAEHALALLLGLVRRVPDMVADAARRQWNVAAFLHDSDTVEGKRLLVVGLGPIGAEVAKRALAFGMRVEAVTRTPRAEPGFEAVYPMSALDERLPRADVVVLCVPLAPETRHLIDARRLALMAPTSYLINIGRGGLIDQPALVDALNGHRLAGAGLDVVDPEPLPADDPLWGCDRLLLSPHVAGGIGLPSMERIADTIEENCRRLLAGRQDLLNRV